MIKNILNLGDAAVYCDFGKDVNQEINTNVINYFKNIKDKKIDGITNITPSYNNIYYTYCPLVWRTSKYLKIILMSIMII